ncbi:hypothetical protein NL676_021980 [Syzygium grande]|nr:hypothetical protein NL676_021980 [Syzygium grande]
MVFLASHAPPPGLAKAFNFPSSIPTVSPSTIDAPFVDLSEFADSIGADDGGRGEHREKPRSLLLLLLLLDCFFQDPFPAGRQAVGPMVDREEEDTKMALASTCPTLTAGKGASPRMSPPSPPRWASPAGLRVAEGGADARGSPWAAVAEKRMPCQGGALERRRLRRLLHLRHSTHRRGRRRRITRSLSLSRSASVDLLR